MTLETDTMRLRPAARMSEEALKRRMDEKSKEFVERGAEVYAEA